MYFPVFWSFFFITLLSLNGNRFFKCILCFPLVQWIEIFCTCIFRVRLFLNTFFTVYTAKLAFIRQMSWKFDTQSALNVFFSLFVYEDKVVLLLQNTPNLQWTQKEKHRLVGPRRLFLNTFFAIYTAKLAFIRQMSWKFDTQSALNVFFSLFKYKDKVVCLLQNTSHLQWTKEKTSTLRSSEEHASHDLKWWHPWTSSYTKKGNRVRTY